MRMVFGLTSLVSVAVLFCAGNSCPGSGNPGGSNDPSKNEFSVRIVGAKETLGETEKLELKAVPLGGKPGGYKFTWSIQPNDLAKPIAKVTAQHDSNLAEIEGVAAGNCVAAVKVEVVAEDAAGNKTRDHKNVRIVKQICKLGMVPNALSYQNGTLWMGTDVGVNRIIENESGEMRLLRHGSDANTVCPFAGTQTQPYIGVVLAMGSNSVWTVACQAKDKGCENSEFFSVPDDCKTQLDPKASSSSAGSNVTVAGHFDVHTLFGSSKGLYQVMPNNTDARLVFDKGQVTALAGDRFGQIWAGTLENGKAQVRVFESSQLTPKASYGPSNWPSGHNGNIGAIIDDSHGGMWIGFSSGEGGLVYRNSSGSWAEKKFVVTGSPVVVDVLVRAMVRDKDGTLWIGTNKGLASIPATPNPQTGSLMIDTLVNPEDGTAQVTDVMALAYDHKRHALWIGQHGANQGLLRYQLNISP